MKISKKRNLRKILQRLSFIRKLIYGHRKMILITGCGRSGTLFISSALTEMGLPIGHERISKFGAASWQLAVDSEKPISYTRLRRRDYNFSITLHQVRNPLDVIKSMHTAGKESWDYIEKFIPIHENDSLTLKCMKYWYYWNLKAEEISSWTYRIEVFQDIFDVFVKKIKHPELLKKKHILNKISIKTHTRKESAKYGKDIKWEDLEKTDRNLCEKIKELARKYGYQITT